MKDEDIKMEFAKMMNVVIGYFMEMAVVIDKKSFPDQYNLIEQFILEKVKEAREEVKRELAEKLPRIIERVIIEYAGLFGTYLSKSEIDCPEFRERISKVLTLIGE